MGEPPAIAFDAVCKSFGDERQILDRVSLTIPRGQFVALVGASGAGKTTLLRLVNRLAEPTAGQVRVEGEDIQAADPVSLRRRIGYVFQGIGLFPHMTVAENIAVTPRLLNWDAARLAVRVDELMRLVRLDPATYLDRFPHELSGSPPVLASC
jgi:osmoprotectant transport system ATP-binding protein